MKAAHYCSVCKRFVRNPWVREVDYYLNESHPAGERDCSYHNAGELDRVHQHGWRQSDGTRTAQTSAGRGQKNPTVWTAVGTSGRTEQRSGGAGQRSGGPAQRAGGSRQQTAPQYGTGTSASRRAEAGGQLEQSLKRQRSGTRTVAALILIFCAISMVGGIVSQLSKPSFSFKEEPEYDVDLGDYEGEDWDWYEENDPSLTDEEAIALGEACTDSGHFSFSGEDLVVPVRDILINCGYQVDGSDPSSINELYADGSSWYETWVTLDLPYSDNSVYQYVEINYDTVTKELHSIHVSMEDPEEASDVIGMIMLYLEDQKLVQTTGNCAFVLMDEMAASLIENEEFTLRDGDVTVSGYQWADAWEISIYPSDEE